MESEGREEKVTGGVEVKEPGTQGTRAHQVERESTEKNYKRRWQRGRHEAGAKFFK